MGNQSSRLYFAGMNHKDIYFHGNYHSKMYLGNELVWEKLDEYQTFRLIIRTEVANETIQLSIFTESRIEVDWGDGTKSFIKTAEAKEKIYSEPGEYLITTSGYFASIVSTNMRHLVEVLDPLPMTSYTENYRNPIFLGCHALKRVTANVFEKIRNLDFSLNQGLFFCECYSLEEIPTDLFKGMSTVTTMYNAFAECGKIQHIPAGLFADMPNISSFFWTFSRCTNLLDIPRGLFDFTTKATTFQGAFYECIFLQEIPKGLFDNVSQAEDFSLCFYGCSRLSEIPTGLFDYTTNATTFSACFYECTSLKSIPTDLFNRITAPTSFSGCFYNCKNITGDVPRLWELFPNANGDGCFYGCTKASNYSDIPTNWRRRA